MPKKSLNKAINKTNQVIILIFFRDNKLLLERRPPKSSFANQSLPPGGGIEIDEINDPILALKRESMEELGGIPQQFQALSHLYGETGKLLKPFLITKWGGVISDTILDKGNSRFWEELDLLENSSLKSLQKIIKESKKLLSNNV